jgi:VRR-NUC domain
MACQHADVSCLNEYELIRKYRCRACSEVMMCSCDESIGRRFLPHQLSLATEIESQRTVPVTKGFEPNVCRVCRGLTPIAHPVASSPGRTSKIKRFYWRELIFREFELAGDLGLTFDEFFLDEESPIRKQLASRALDEIKAQHKKTPKYSLETESEHDFLCRVQIPTIVLTAHAKSGGEVEVSTGVFVSPETYAALYFERNGFSSIECESVPFHILFGTLLWLLIQSPSDSRLRDVAFGERNSYESNRASNSMIWTQLPDDFGTAAYAERRISAIDEFFETQLPKQTDDLLFMFDWCLSGSSALRQYLWAHRDADIKRARALLQLLPPDVVRLALAYLIGDYWRRYLGWPDLFVWNQTQYKFVEVKLGADKLSDDQRAWIEANANLLHFPFEILKIHRAPERAKT